MEKNAAQERAVIAGKLTNVLDARTLQTSNKRLGEILTSGIAVLDVGCGTGSITQGIAAAVGPNGRVVGIDNNAGLITNASVAHQDIPALTFAVDDIYNLSSYVSQFDIATCARVFVWLSEPLRALYAMKAVVKTGGRIVITDYNHEKIKWEPSPPQSMLSFYDAYLQWRSDAGLDNAIADHLAALFEQAGLSQISVTPQHEATFRGDTDFVQRITLWADTASSRGPQMAGDGYISEGEYMRAEQEYREWSVHDAESMTMYMNAVEGIVV